MSDMHEVEKIVEERHRMQPNVFNGGVGRYPVPVSEFRIRWKGFGPNEDTWEPLKNIHNGVKVLATPFRAHFPP